ncbi:hypothetical protein VTN96DRAFT_5586 [Rasamsonia emersonii]
MVVYRLKYSKYLQFSREDWILSSLLGQISQVLIPQNTYTKPDLAACGMSFVVRRLAGDTAIISPREPARDWRCRASWTS